jgi:heterotetrameric sarcosine oxidase gamma subunit
VSDDAVVARSPIAAAAPVRLEAGWEVSGRHSDAALTITDCTPLTKVHVRAPWNGAMAKALGVPFGRASRDAGWLLAGSGPGEWLAFAPPGAGEQVVSRLTETAAGSAPEEFISIIDLTHGRALVRVTGEAAPDLLALLCPVDLDGDMTPDGAAFRSSLAGIATDFVRDDRGGRRSYLMHCERSSGQYLFDSLVSAGKPLGLDIDGFAAPGI